MSSPSRHALATHTIALYPAAARQRSPHVLLVTTCLALATLTGCGARGGVEGTEAASAGGQAATSAAPPPAATVAAPTTKRARASATMGSRNTTAVSAPDVRATAEDQLASIRAEHARRQPMPPGVLISEEDAVRSALSRFDPEWGVGRSTVLLVQWRDLERWMWDDPTERQICTSWQQRTPDELIYVVTSQLDESLDPRNQPVSPRALVSAADGGAVGFLLRGAPPASLDPRTARQEDLATPLATSTASIFPAATQAPLEPQLSAACSVEPLVERFRSHEGRDTSKETAPAVMEASPAVRESLRRFPLLPGNSWTYHGGGRSTCEGWWGSRTVEKVVDLVLPAPDLALIAVEQLDEPRAGASGFVDRPRPGRRSCHHLALWNDELYLLGTGTADGPTLTMEWNRSTQRLRPGEPLDSVLDLRALVSPPTVAPQPAYPTQQATVDRPVPMIRLSGPDARPPLPDVGWPRNREVSTTEPPEAWKEARGCLVWMRGGHQNATFTFCEEIGIVQVERWGSNYTSYDRLVQVDLPNRIDNAAIDE